MQSHISWRRKVERVDFIVGGVQKAGTTALHDFLAQHPHVALLRDQALHFFDKEDPEAGQPVRASGPSTQ